MTTILSKDPIEVVRASLLRHIISELKELYDMRDADTYVGSIKKSIGDLTVDLLEYEEAEKEAKRQQIRDAASVASEKVGKLLFGTEG